MSLTLAGKLILWYESQQVAKSGGIGSRFIHCRPMSISIHGFRLIGTIGFPSPIHDRLAGSLVRDVAAGKGQHRGRYAELER